MIKYVRRVPTSDMCLTSADISPNFASKITHIHGTGVSEGNFLGKATLFPRIKPYDNALNESCLGRVIRYSPLNKTGLAIHFMSKSILVRINGLKIVKSE